MIHPSWLEIDLAALSENHASIRQWAGGDVDLCAVVKADAYGLGCVPVARRLAEDGVSMLAVYNGDQARQLIEAGITAPLLVLMPVHELDRRDPVYRALVSGRMHLTVHSPEHADQIEQIGKHLGAVMPIHLEIDTGMSRCGMSAEQAERLLATLGERRWLKLSGIFTHPASADTDPIMTDRQMAALDAVLERCAEVLKTSLPHVGQGPRQAADSPRCESHGSSPSPRPSPLKGEGVVVHFANTHAMLRGRKYHRQMLRIGLSLFGLGDTDLAGGETNRPVLKPIVSWLSRIAHLREVPAGSPVGYGGTFTTWRHSRLAVVPLGYADGYPVALSNRAVVRIGPNRQHAAVRGRVSMAQLTVDVTEIPDAQLGAEVEVYAGDPQAPNSVPRLAELARTHCYELLCRLSARIERRYVTKPSGNSAAPMSTPVRREL